MLGKNSRLYNSILNVGTTAMATLFTMLLSIVVRAFLNRNLGTNYVGLTGILTSVITSLSITDLGIDSVFIYLLYKPMADRNTDEIGKLMVLFKRVYMWIGTFFLLLGVICVPFLKYLVGAQAMRIPNIHLIFFLYLLNTGISYFFAAYRVILNADQKYYIIARITFLTTFVTNFLQIIGLLLIKSFVLYVTLLLLSTIATNLIIGSVSIKRYGLRKLPRERINNIKFENDETIPTLIHNTIGGISNKLGVIFVNSSDNIMLANFETLRIVGMYSNYLMITNGVSSLLSKMIASVTASVGNLGSEGNKGKNLTTFVKLTTIINFLVIMAVIPMSLFFGTFINIWVGGKNILPVVPTILITLNCLLAVIRYPALTFIDAFGLQWIQRWKSIVESAVNVGVALILLIVFKMGLNGVLLGTLCSNLLVVNWYEPFLVLREVCGRRYRQYLAEVIPAFALFIGAVLFSLVVLMSGVIGISLWRSLVVIVISEAILLTIVYFVFRNSLGMELITSIFGRFFKRRTV